MFGLNECEPLFYSLLGRSLNTICMVQSLLVKMMVVNLFILRPGFTVYQTDRHCVHTSMSPERKPVHFNHTSGFRNNS